MTPADFVEQCLLGSLLHTPSRIDELGSGLVEGDFTDPTRGVLYRILRQNAGRVVSVLGDVGERALELQARDLVDGIAAFGDHQIGAEDLARLMAAVPPSGGQPAVYGEIVVEASIRRQIVELGTAVGQFCADTPPVADLVTCAESATAQVAGAQNRWAAVTRTRSLGRALSGDALDAADQFHASATPPERPAPTGTVPTVAELLNAQEQVIGGILSDQDTADVLLGKLVPRDFADEELASAFGAAVDVHNTAAATGRRVDPVTVMWHLQAASSVRVPPPQRLLDLAHDVDRGDLVRAVELVMRDSLARHAATVAATTRQSTGQLTAPLEEALADARAGYKSIVDTVHRMTGQTSTDSRLTVLDNRATHLSAQFPRTDAALSDLRSRSANLIDVAVTRTDVDAIPYQGLRTRVELQSQPESLDRHQEVHADATTGLS